MLRTGSATLMSPNISNISWVQRAGISLGTVNAGMVNEAGRALPLAVIPAQAGTHDNAPQLADSTRPRGSNTERPLPMIWRTVVVGAGLRRDDDCGWAMLGKAICSVHILAYFSVTAPAIATSHGSSSGLSREPMVQQGLRRLNRQLRQRIPPTQRHRLDGWVLGTKPEDDTCAVRGALWRQESRIGTLSPYFFIFFPY